MSLQLTHLTPPGYTVVDAIHKIIDAAVRPSGLTTRRLILTVASFVTLDASRDGTPPADVRSFVMEGFDPAGPSNAHTTAYNWLKSLPEFAGAVDV